MWKKYVFPQEKSIKILFQGVLWETVSVSSESRYEFVGSIDEKV
jgi:hypothetical protein